MTGIIPADAVAIGVGAFLGALSRYQCGRLAAEWIATDPNKLGKLSGWHTAGINIGGSFLLGGIAASPGIASSQTPPPPPGVTGRLVKPTLLTPPSTSNSLFANRFQGLSPRTKLMLGVGFCGSYTTFSTYSVDVVTWLSQGQTTKALSYIATNNVGGFVAAAAGMLLVKRFFGG
jgi:fluoride ion exporter CrcB/FEX